MNTEIKILKINDNTWRIEDGHVRFFLLEGETRSLMIDSGIDTPNAKEIAMQITDKPLFLLNTHGDGDHTSGNAAFDQFYVSKADYEMCGFKEAFPNSKPVFVNDGDILDLGNRKLKLISIPGHTYGSTAILDIQARILFSGDSVSNAIIYMFGERRNISEYRESLKKLKNMKSEFDAIYPSHGDPKLSPDAIDKVETDLSAVLEGKITGTDEEIHGSKVKTYRGEFCGFYLPVK